MKYAKGGVQAKTGEIVPVEIPGKGGVKPAAAQPAQPAAQKPPDSKDRARMSIFTFGLPFCTAVSAQVKFDARQLDMLQGHVDDVTIVYTVAPPERNWTGRGTVVTDTAIDWSGGFKPWGVSAARADCINALASELHNRKVQLIIGYTVGNDPNNHAGDSYCTAFTNWLAAMSKDQVKAHAQAVVDFVKKYNCDGISFDLEIVSLGEAQRDNLKLLYQSVSDGLAPGGGMVAYANAPFTKDGEVDGVTVMSGMKIQGWELTKGIPNLVSRPMCYDTLDLSYELIGRSIDYAMGASGLGAKGLQLGLFATAPRHGNLQKTLDFIKDKMQPTRIGLVYYQVPYFDNPPGATTRALENVIKCDQALNPEGTKAPTDPAQPIQAPRT